MDEHKPLVMLVDDDKNFRTLARKALEINNFDIIEAGDGREAVDQFKLHLPALMLLDVLMPKMDGIEACRLIRQSPQGKQVPIVMVTGVDDINSINHAYEAGATDFVTKPVNWLILSKRIQFIHRASRIMSTVVDQEVEKFLRLYASDRESLPQEFNPAGAEETEWLKNMNAIRGIIGEDVFDKFIQNVLFEISSIIYRIKHAAEMSHIHDVKQLNHHLKTKCATIYASNIIAYCEILNSACEREIVTNITYVVDKIEYEFFVLKETLHNVLRQPSSAL